MRQIRFILILAIVLALFGKCKETTSESYLNAGSIDSVLRLADSLSKKDFNEYLKYNAKLLTLAYGSGEEEAFDRVIGDFSIGSAKAGRESDLVITLIQLLEVIEKPYYTQRTFKAIADVYYNLDDAEASLYYDIKGLEAARKLGDPRRIALMQNNIGDDYLIEGDLGKAAYFFDIAYQSAVKLGATKLMAITTSSKGHVLLFQKKFEESLSFLNYSKRLSKVINEPEGVVYCNLWIGMCYFGKRNFELANIYFDSVYHTSVYLLLPRDRLEFLLHKARTEHFLGKTDSAYFVLEQHLSLQDSLQATVKVKALQKIALNLYHKEERERNTLLYIILASILTIAIVVLSAGFIYSIKTRRIQQRVFDEMNQLKSKFFANISHEFRTPLTLILGPLKDMREGTLRGDQKTVLATMIRNGERLLRLINQLLDLSKIEAGKMIMQASKTDIVDFLKEIASSYESLAADKKIRFFFYPELQELLVYIDPEKIEKVIHNLLSNAFKFTPQGGEVILNLRVKENQWASVSVKDTGIGIPEDQLDKVFDRFYQVDSSQTRDYEGSGLGLAVAKELVTLHRGRIIVESKEGKGTIVTLWLSLGKEHLSKGEIIDSVKTKTFSPELMPTDILVPENENETPTVSSDQRPVLLIVEDNADMRRYIAKTLSEHYQVIEAENGRAGVKLAEESIPDLIISDIMMPVMDGYKLCELIKSNELTSHIPIVLLTAKADRESKLIGLETGADDYLSKPFDADQLKLIVRNRIEERRKLRERFSREVSLEPKQISITSLDEKFLKKVLDIIEIHMDDESFSIEDFGQEVGYSKIHFYRKIKSLSGQSPSLFLRTIRLKRAADLLSNHSDNVSQIAYSVGFNSLSYFNKCFKEQFGVTPGQFSESNKAKS